MSTMKHSAANSRVFRSSPWSAVRTLIVEWRRRVRSRYELRSLGDAELRDIGLTRSDVNDATALPLDADPSGLLVKRRAWRERSVGLLDDERVFHMLERSMA